MNRKKKVLLLSDDLRMNSGIATVSRQLVMGTADRYDWVQLGAAIQHPEHGKMIDISGDVKKHTGIEDASVKILANSGYGTPELLRQLINIEQPDIIIHFTDPRYWVWLYEIAHEIREIVPLTFLTIWDCLPSPTYNANFYASCDSLFCISKQTYGIVNRVLFDEFSDELNIIKNDGSSLTERTWSDGM